jgi:hypothetical protein
LRRTLFGKICPILAGAGIRNVPYLLRNPVPRRVTYSGEIG